MNSITQKLIAETGTDVSGKWISIDNAEKFAELIVKECVELNKQELAFNAFERLLNIYKEHFGVEE